MHTVCSIPTYLSTYTYILVYVTVYMTGLSIRENSAIMLLVSFLLRLGINSIM